MSDINCHARRSEHNYPMAEWLTIRLSLALAHDGQLGRHDPVEQCLSLPEFRTYKFERLIYLLFLGSLRSAGDERWLYVPCDVNSGCKFVRSF